MWDFGKKVSKRRAVIFTLSKMQNKLIDTIREPDHRVLIQKIVLSVVLLMPIFLFAQKCDSTKKKSSVAVFPAISFAPETNLQFGVAAVLVLKVNKENPSAYLRQSTLSPFFLYTLKNQIISAINLTYFTPNGKLLDGSVRYLNFPDAYFGIGNDNDPDVFEVYTNTFLQLRGAYLKSTSAKTFLGIGWDAQFNDVRRIVPDGRLESDNVAGIDGGFLLGLGPAMRYDTRNNTIYPSKGYFVTLSALFTYLGDFSYTNYSIDARKYISLWNEDNILAFQLFSGMNTGANIPFYKLPQLGGDDRLRGISNASLYRDRQMVYFQAEYRIPLFWRFGMVAFAGVGDVAGGFGDFNVSEFKYVFGMGGRMAVISEDKLNLRLDLGVARGGQIGIYAGISEAF